MAKCCQYRINCDTALLTNYSSEGAEPFPPYYAVVYPPVVDPPIDSPWNHPGCLYLCISYISQEDADLCALRQAVLCEPGEIWYSAEASCTVTCPDGTGSSTFTVPAGMFVAHTYAEALEKAQTYACNMVQDNRICIGSIQRCACLGVEYTAVISLEIARTDLTWFIVGSLPPGLSLVTGGGVAVITGTPTVSGTYAFQVTATAPNGSYGVKTMTISVLEITTASLPNFTIGVAYSQQMQAAGGSGNYIWSIATGTLPAGLTMNALGLISGTPTALATGDTLTFVVTDVTC